MDSRKTHLNLLPSAFYQALVGAPLWLYVLLHPNYSLFADPRLPQVGGGVLGDVWRAEERGKAIAIYSLAPLLGPVVGPVCGGWIAERSTWRWVVSAPSRPSHWCMLMDSSMQFWSTSIADVIVQISGLFFLQESESCFPFFRCAILPYDSLRSIASRKESRSYAENDGCGKGLHQGDQDCLR